MIDKDTLSTKLFIMGAKEDFEDVAKSIYTSTNPKKYSMLDYEGIIDKMCKYIEGYVDYKASGDNKFNGKVLSTTRTFYDNMFNDKKYRKVLKLKEIQDSHKQFLISTKKLQSLLEKYIDKQDYDYELQQLITMSNNQYKKLSKVYKDDMDIYRWQATLDSKLYSYPIPAATRANFYDINTPVIHPANLKKKPIDPEHDINDDSTAYDDPDIDE